MQQQLHSMSSFHASVQARSPCAGASAGSWAVRFSRIAVQGSARLAVPFILLAVGVVPAAVVFDVCLHCSTTQLQHNTGQGISRW